MRFGKLDGVKLDKRGSWEVVEVAK